MKIRHCIALSALALLAASALAAPVVMDEAVAKLSHAWAKAEFRTPIDTRAAALHELTAVADQVVRDFPDKAEPLVWQAIALSSEAEIEGGLGALSKVKKARDLLLRAEKIDPTALDGSIYCTLGSLYAKVPGWPIGFGDKGLAKQYLQKALGINPGGIDPNYFYGELLANQGQYADAAAHLRTALATPPRLGREDSDKGRHEQASRLLETLQQKHTQQLADR